MMIAPLIAAMLLVVSQPPSPRCLGIYRVTAYCPGPCCCGAWADGITASGAPVTANGGRFVAADTELLPFGTRLVIPGYARGAAVPVLDRGGAIRGRRLDVFFTTHAAALAWGVRELTIWEERP